MNYFDNSAKSLCCGCTACKNICPTKAIIMKEDRDGYIYPEIDSQKCIHCELCKNVCPFAISDKLKNPIADTCYALAINDKNELFESTSGGAATAIINAFCDKDYSVFGAEMCDDLCVRHTEAKTIEETKKFRKSKYTKSDTSTAYVSAKIALEKGDKVLFFGTGCQIAGLRGFLRKDYDNLLTVDLVCHGVPSNKIFKAYIQYLEKKHKSSIIDYQFRSKRRKYNPLLPSLGKVKITLSNGKEFKKTSYFDYYMRLFWAYIYMPSCHNCCFACRERVGDITIADFWGIEKYSKQFNTTKGTSLVIPSTEKGKRVLASFRDVKLFKTDIENAIKHNANLTKPAAIHKNKEKFLTDLWNKDIKFSVDKNLGKPPAKLYVSALTPSFVKEIIKKMSK